MQNACFGGKMRMANNQMFQNLNFWYKFIKISFEGEPF